MSRRFVAMVVGVLALVAPPLVGVGQAAQGVTAPDSLSLESFWVLMQYQRDPRGYAQRVLQLGRGPIERVPTVVLLGAGDAYLRTGRSRGADRSFLEVVRREAGPPWHTMALLGLGWSAVLRGDFSTARARFDQVPKHDEMSPIAQVMGGWLAAIQGDLGNAIRILSPWGNAVGAPDSVRQVALLGAGYAHYWAGGFTQAREFFERLEAVSGRSADPLLDDARYAAAVALVRSGDVDAGLAELRELVREDRLAEDEEVHVPRSQVMLSSRSVIRAGRATGMAASNTIDAQARMVALFDGDGRRLARAALRLLDPDPDPPATGNPAPAPASALAEEAVSGNHPAPVPSSNDTQRRRHARHAGQADAITPWTWWSLLLALFFAVAGGVMLNHLRRGHDRPLGSPRRR